MKPQDKIRVVKELLKELHRGASVDELKEKFRDIIVSITPFEIPLIEQQLVREGIPIRDILKLCDLHVELFREALASRELEGVPQGHPLDLLVRENEHILKMSEALSLYANALLRAKNRHEAEKHAEALKRIVGDLKKIRIHYRKIQMGIFPYFERRGIIAVPRVLWGREDQVIVKLRKLARLLEEASDPYAERGRLAAEALDVAKEIGELVFRENKILYPASWALLSEGEWAAVKEVFDDIGYLVEVKDEWKPRAEPILPYQVENPVVSREQLEKLPPEMRRVLEAQGLEPDRYKVVGKEDLDLGTGFLTLKELKAVLASLPVEVTYADKNDRVKFYTQSRLHKGFVRTKTIIGRRVEFCHPPRLEELVRKTVDEIKSGERDMAEFWTRQGDRIIRVLIAGVKNGDGEYLGTLEIVEDLTEVVENPEQIKEKIIVL